MSLSIRDPIYGFIQLNELEKNLIQTYPFQRLRFIHQLGTTSWVYPTGIHTRFDHSLGVLHLASIVIERLNNLGISLKKEDSTVFRLSCLLHDIGHPPFSHVGEDMGLFIGGLNHEKMGIKIIKETEISYEISKFLGEEVLDRISFIITGKGKPTSSLDNLFHIILAGQAGIDRMDYLLRDSYFLGVMYGKFDLARILETLRYDEEKGIYWEEGGIHALEQFLLARYFMFTEVYFHKTRRILDYHLAQLLKSYLKKHLNNEEHGCFPVNIDEYLNLQDHKIITWMMENDNLHKDIFMKRKFFKKIDPESSDHPEKYEIVLWKWLEDELKRTFQQEEYFFDKAEKAPYKFEKADILVVSSGKLMPIHEVSKLVDSLKPIKKRRIYAKESQKEELSKFVETFLNKKKMEV